MNNSYKYGVSMKLDLSTITLFKLQYNDNYNYCNNFHHND